jgi:hypothetical protein
MNRLSSVQSFPSCSLKVIKHKELKCPIILARRMQTLQGRGPFNKHWGGGTEDGGGPRSQAELPPNAFMVLVLCVV